MEDGVIWETLEPTVISTAGPNITMRLRGFVENMGPGPGNETRDFEFCLSDTVFLCLGVTFGDIFPSEDSKRAVTGANNQTPPQPLQTFDVSIAPEDTFRVRFSLNESGLVFGAKPFETAGVIIFTTPAVQAVTPIDPGDHPLGPGLVSLGLPPDLSLFAIGVMLLVLSLFIVAIIGGGDDKDFIMVMLMGVSANVFLRFWPAIVGIFLWLFVGWTLVTQLTKTGAGNGPD